MDYTPALTPQEYKAAYLWDELNKLRRAVANKDEGIAVACSDETTALTTGTKVTFRVPYALTLKEMRASLTTAQTSGNIFTVDVKNGGTSIFSTKITIDNNEKTTATAATPNVISRKDVAKDAEITIIIDQVGNGTAAGLKVYFVGGQIP